MTARQGRTSEYLVKDLEGNVVAEHRYPEQAAKLFAAEAWNSNTDKRLTPKKINTVDSAKKLFHYFLYGVLGDGRAVDVAPIFGIGALPMHVGWRPSRHAFKNPFKSPFKSPCKHAFKSLSIRTFKSLSIRAFKSPSIRACMFPFNHEVLAVSRDAVVLKYAVQQMLNTSGKA